jgi:hypothetical protein
MDLMLFILLIEHEKAYGNVSRKTEWHIKIRLNSNKIATSHQQLTEIQQQE